MTDSVVCTRSVKDERTAIMEWNEIPDRGPE